MKNTLFRTIFRWSRNILLGIILITVVGLLFWAFFPTSAPPLRDANGKPIEGGIATLEPVTIGGETQWISIRGQNPDAPVLLFLHGGPGSSDIPLTRKYFAGTIESHFVVVNWDQRGAGKSYDAGKQGH